MPFRDIVGHRRPSELLARAVASGSLPPSLIFSGPDGVGKCATAYAAAQALNCPTPVRDVKGPGGAALPIDACGECIVCRRIARRVHPDVVALSPSDDRVSVTIEQVRAINEQIAYRPFEARRRVVIVDNAADVLLPPSQNALLKTLEEPPSGTVFILVTAQIEGLLPTVRSRCPVVRFAPIPADDLVSLLQTRHGLDATTARARAATADGSVSAALNAPDLQDVRMGARRLLERVARARDPRARLDATRDITGKAPKSSGLGERDSLALHLRLLHSLLRDVGVIASKGDARAIANTDLRDALEPLAGAYGGERLVGAFAAIDRALAALERNASPKIVADWLVLQL